MKNNLNLKVKKLLKAIVVLILKIMMIYIKKVF